MMKTKNNNSRRQFIGALALGATASTIGVLTNPIYAKSPSAALTAMNSADD